MRRWVLGVIACASLSAQTPRDLYLAHCAGCHGPSGEGSRGPALKAVALQRANDPDSLVVLLRRGIPGTEMPALAPETVADQPLHELAIYVLGLRTKAQGAATDRPGRGAELFRTKGKCLTCHRVNGEGHTSGPDLSDIGRLREPQWLRRAVVEPEAALYDSFGGYRWTINLPDNYLMVEVSTRSGDRITGSRLNEDAFSIQIRDGEGHIRSFLKSEVSEVRKQWGRSPMPPYRDVFSSGELEDLVAYLVSLRGLR
ncbi:MAG TPA: c-type cytochrome [Bryobacteraceae bacterium]|jgi:putative heme-binding domain-containing protein|nr:c-type cytochrome [Bryobacteraceae bacterium]